MPALGKRHKTGSLKRPPAAALSALQGRVCTSQASSGAHPKRENCLQFTQLFLSSLQSRGNSPVTQIKYQPLKLISVTSVDVSPFLSPQQPNQRVTLPVCLKAPTPRRVERERAARGPPPLDWDSLGAAACACPQLCAPTGEGSREEVKL